MATWVMQVSFDPRMIGFALQKTSYTYGLVEQGRVFALNIFNKADTESIKSFTKGRAKKPDKMESADYEAGPKTGSPILAGAAAYLECEVVKIVDFGGDHDIVVGKIVGGEVRKPGEAADTLSLVDLGWSYAG